MQPQDDFFCSYPKFAQKPNPQAEFKLSTFANLIDGFKNGICWL